MRWLAALLLALASPAWADLCTEHHVGLVTVSKHLSSSKEYNETHWGPYWRCQFSHDWSWQAGWYPNSFKRDTVYALANYVPGRWRLDPADVTLKVGITGGLGTGYAKHSDGRPSKWRLTPIVGGLVALELEKSIHLGLFVNPAVVAVVVEFQVR